MIDLPIEFIAGVAFSAISSAMIGFLVARWLYAERATLRVSILQKEIMRQRRRIAEKNDEKAVSDRQLSRVRRDLKGSMAPPRLLEHKVAKKPTSLRRYDRSYGAPPVELKNPAVK